LCEEISERSRAGQISIAHLLILAIDQDQNHGRDSSLSQHVVQDHRRWNVGIREIAIYLSVKDDYEPVRLSLRIKPGRGTDRIAPLLVQDSALDSEPCQSTPGHAGAFLDVWLGGSACELKARPEREGARVHQVGRSCREMYCPGLGDLAVGIECVNSAGSLGYHFGSVPQIGVEQPGQRFVVRPFLGQPAHKRDPFSAGVAPPDKGDPRIQVVAGYRLYEGSIVARSIPKCRELVTFSGLECCRQPGQRGANYGRGVSRGCVYPAPYLVPPGL